MISRIPCEPNEDTSGFYGFNWPTFAQREESIALDITLPVLLVDDQQIMVDLTRRILARLGFEHVDHTGDGHQALAMLRQGNYNPVIPDLHMESTGGIQWTRAARADEQ